MDSCRYCNHEHDLNDRLIESRELTIGLTSGIVRGATIFICQDALACGRRRQKAEDDRRDPPISYGTGVDGYRIAPQ